MTLKRYHAKRDFKKTGEPKGRVEKSGAGRIFVVQKHAATRLHYDLRLEAGGVLKSWAVPKGPSYDPSQKRLAVEVEDHPLDYGDFEGTIPEKQYGAGTVMLWDKGVWEAEGSWREGLESGKLKFRLYGSKLKGGWTLVRTHTAERDSGKVSWLLIKERDAEARTPGEYDVTAELTRSVKTGRTMEEIRDNTPQKSLPAAPNEVRTVPESVYGAVRGRKSAWPKHFIPQMATLVSGPPTGDRWLYEIKFDGYRLLAMIRDGATRLMTRRGQNWTDRFRSIAEELSGLPVENAILDGEIVVENPDGTTDFQKLQNLMRESRTAALVYYVFDIPFFDGRDLTGVPLLERKELLRVLLETNKGVIPSVRYSEHLTGQGDRIFDAACGQKIEGVVAKLKDSSYVQGRSRSWLKLKCTKRQEFVIGGYTAPRGSRSGFGSLLLGYYDDRKRLIYSGNVGTGFDAKTIRALFDRLQEFRQDHSPFSFAIEDHLRRKAYWVRPLLVCEVEFSSWTEAGLLRHPSFLGIREDKAPQEITLEKELRPPEPSRGETPKRRRSRKGELLLLRGVEITNPGRVLYPEAGITKRDLAEFYARIEKWIMPELSGRPLTLVRCPEGIEKGCFFQKHLGDDVPEWIKSVQIKEKKEVLPYLYVDDIKGLLSLAQMGVLEIHTWGSRTDHLEYPDRMIFDLDPSPEISKEQLAEATLFFREWLLKNEIEPLFKTTGGKGLHVVVRLKPTLTWDEVRGLSEGIARELVRMRPELFTDTIAKKVRRGKILVDYFRNNRGATAIAPYSTRSLPGAPVALPIFDSEISGCFLSRTFGISEALGRLMKMRRDPWAKKRGRSEG